MKTNTQAQAQAVQVDNEKPTVPPLTEKELRVGREIQRRKQDRRDFGPQIKYGERWP